VTKLTEIIDVIALRAEVELGNVRIQTHPEFPHLMIANYTDQCAFDRHWNDVTRITRGLIWNDETGEVLARPFPKFFNFDEKEAPRILDDQVVYSYDNKFDGSLGILYERPDGVFAIATRGSFNSDQAKLGTKLFYEWDEADRSYYTGAIRDGATPLFEICGPDNRIVLSYDENFLAPLGFMNIEHGYFTPDGPPIAATMHTLLMDLSRTNAEGWVVWKTAYEAVKIKQADYIELHRIVSNLSEKEVWRQLRAGTYDDFKVKLPDEWHAWAEGIADRLRDEFLLIRMDAWADAYTLENLHLDSRKEQAFWISDNVAFQHRGLVFSLLDGKDISDSIWRMIEPKGV
jgi:RNA ligase